MHQKKIKIVPQLSQLIQSNKKYLSENKIMFELDSPTHPKKEGPNIDIAFRNITYSVEVLDDKVQQSPLPCFKQYTQKELLKNVSGIFNAGKLTAIMGASGAGKTTLLNTIACRVSPKLLSGTVTANTNPYTFETFGDFANYVMQQDVLIQTLTVRQTLAFAADLKLEADEEEKKNRIERLAKQFKLEKCLDVLVGGAQLKGISGGERKRTSIAFEMISDPGVLVLDEPTSGLDSLTSFIIVRHLKKVAALEGKTVLMTIHQPNSEIYDLFDNLILMVEGKFIYQGPASTATDYFGRHFGLECPEFANPADYFMTMMHHENPDNVRRYPAYFDAYDKYCAPAIQEELKNQKTNEVGKRDIQVSCGASMKALLGRDFVNVIRNPMLIKMRFVQTIFISLYAGWLYYQFNGNYVDTLNWRALTGFFFFLSINLTMLALAPVQLVFPSERSVFLKEEGAKLYNTFNYFLSRNIIEIPYTFIFPLIQCLIMYWFVGLSSTASQFFVTYLIAWLLTINGVSLGLMLGSIVTDAKSVSVVTPAIMLPFFLFSGFFKNSANLPVWIGWIEYLSPVKYGFSAFVQNQVRMASVSLVEQLNFDTSMWLSIGLLFVLGFSFRLTSLFFLWKLRARLE